MGWIAAGMRYHTWLSLVSPSLRIMAMRAITASEFFPSETMVVCSFMTTMRSADPSISILTWVRVSECVCVCVRERVGVSVQ